MPCQANYFNVFKSVLNKKSNVNYQAIVFGKITNHKIKKVGNFYITEYKLIPQKWIYKNHSIQEKKYLTLKILGADLPEKGIVIKSSAAPNFIPVNREAIFLLVNTKKKENNVFTLLPDGIIYGESLKDYGRFIQ